MSPPLTESDPSAADWLGELQRQGLRLWLDGDKLRCSGPEALLTDGLYATLKTRRDELKALLRAQGPVPVPRDGVLPLSFAQQRLWFLEQMPQEAGVYNVPLALRIRGGLDVALLSRVLDGLLRRHEVLRTRYVAEHGRPRPDIDAPAPLPLPLVDLRGHADADAQLQQRLAREAAAPFDLARQWPLRATLLRLGEQEHVLALTLHHIACDAWSLELLTAEIGRGWRAALLGAAAPADDGSTRAQYVDFAAWQHSPVQAAARAGERDYWQRALASAPTVLCLATDHPRPRLQTHRGALHAFSLAPAEVAAVRRCGQAQAATPFMVLLAAWQLLLARISGQHDLLVAVPVANRQPQALEPLIGLFVNTLALRARVQPAAGFEALLAQVRETTLGALAHAQLPFEQLIELLQLERDLSRHPLCQAKFRLEPAPAARTELPGLALERLPQAEVRAKLDLSLDMAEGSDGTMHAALEYNADLFEPQTIARLADAYRALLAAALAQPQRPVGTLPLLGAAQRERQLLQWNASARPYHGGTCWHHLVEAVAQAQPQDIALAMDTPPQQIDYATLNARANQLAHWLRGAGIGPERVVGIALPRSPQMIVAMLAVLKAGGAYLPLDTAYPPQRLAFMLQDARVPVVLSDSRVALPAVDTPLRRLDLDRDWPATQPTANPVALAGPQHLAYLIYTSGSTGQPKGVMVEHGGLVNLTEDKIRTCEVRRGDCVLQYFSFGFDASIPDIVMALAAGAKLLLAPAGLLPGPEMAALIERQRVTHVLMTPSALLALPAHDFPDLRMVLVGGEAPTPALIDRWSAGGRLFINAYGPTETTVNASMVRCSHGAPAEATLRPAANKQLYILDEALELLPPGTPGELCIGGVGLARGYLGRAALTAGKFVPNPFRQSGDAEASACLYRSGDLALQGEDGRIRVLGRIDRQVKIRGFRIELGDIERALAAHAQVQLALADVIDGPDGERRLAAWAVPRDGVARVGEAALRQHLAERLPRQMLPARVLWVETLPLNAHGKVDLPALARLAARPDAAATPQPARTPTEAAVAEAFAQALGLPQVSAGDDFFALGGHSLLATRLVAGLLERLALPVTVVDLFEAPTVSALAQRLEHKRKLARLRRADEASSGEREEITL